LLSNALPLINTYKKQKYNEINFTYQSEYLYDSATSPYLVDNVRLISAKPDNGIEIGSAAINEATWIFIDLSHIIAADNPTDQHLSNIQFL